MSNGQNLTDAELDASFTKADTDADGKLSLEELKIFLKVPAVAEPEKPPVDPVTPGTNETTPTDNNTKPFEPEPTKNETIPVEPEPIKNETQPTETAKILPPNATEQEVSDFFKNADSDADGFLTKEEIKAAFTANG